MTLFPVKGWVKIGGTLQRRPSSTVVGGTAVTVTTVTDTSVTITWTLAAGATGYLVGRDGIDSKGVGAWSTVDASGVTSRTFINLKPSTAYNLYVEPQPGGPRTTVTVTTGATPVTPPTSVAWDWSTSNRPQAYTDPSAFTEGWPSDTVYVNLQTGSNDFYTNLQSTVSSASAFASKFVIRLEAKVYHLAAFVPTGSDPLYAFGIYFGALQGFLGHGWDQTIIQMDAGKMTTAQLNAIQALTATGAGSPLQMALARFDGVTAGKPVLLGGVQFRAADQQNITSVTSSVPAVVPQPAPHQGVFFYPGSTAIINNCAFIGAGRAITSSPPFEMANVTSQRVTITYRRCEFDGRRSPDIDPALPRRCGPFMFNNDSATMIDCWAHHSNVSRGAINDGNTGPSGPYSFTRLKMEQITNTHNTDPALNNGQSLGGYTNASLIGFESSHAAITFTDCIWSEDNAFTDGQISQMLQFTSVQTNPQGGRCTIVRGIYRNTAFPGIDGYLTCRISPSTFWYTDGLATTINFTGDDGNRKTAFVTSGSWPPSPSTLAAAGVSPATHYLVRTS